MQIGLHEQAWMNVNFMAEIRKKKHAFERYKQTRNGKECLDYTRARNSTNLVELSQRHGKQSRDYKKEIAKKAQQNPKACYWYVNGKLKTRS